jgi:hypothetical protein
LTTIPLYIADSDGFGMEDYDEENVCAVIDSNLDIISPFCPIEDVAALLKEIRNKRKGTARKQQIMNFLINKSKMQNYFM